MLPFTPNSHEQLLSSGCLFCAAAQDSPEYTAQDNASKELGSVWPGCDTGEVFIILVRLGHQQSEQGCHQTPSFILSPFCLSILTFSDVPPIGTGNYLLPYLLWISPIVSTSLSAPTLHTPHASLKS